MLFVELLNGVKSKGNGGQKGVFCRPITNRLAQTTIFGLAQPNLNVSVFLIPTNISFEMVFDNTPSFLRTKNVRTRGLIITKFGQFDEVPVRLWALGIA